MKALRHIILFFSICSIWVDAQSQANSYHGAVAVELLKSLHVRHVQNGSSVFVRVIADWNGLGCSLRRGAIVEAKVEVAVPRVKGGNGSQLALSFDKAQCSGAEMAPLDLVLAAVYWTPDDRDTSGDYPIVRYGSTQNASLGVSPQAASMQQSLSIIGIESIGLNKLAARPNLHAGDVYGIRGLKLRIGAGPGRSSVLSSKDRDVSLEESTQFLLVPSSVAFLSIPVSVAESSPPGAGATSKPLPHPLSSAGRPSPAMEFESCQPPSCTVDLPTADEAIPGHPAKSFQISALGYAPRPIKEISQLENDEALQWLGPHQLLLAFNPHTLVPRDAAIAADTPVREIHAALLDTEANQVLSTADWELPDTGRYLWQLSGNRILVHAGDELRVYDSKLALISRVALAGPLAFVQISPNGELIAIAVIKERHTEELHRRLRDALDREPEEDVDILILNQQFKTIARATTTSNIMPPILLNEGQVTLLAGSRGRYRISMLTWENQSRTLARFTSVCTPGLLSLAPDLVLVHTCGSSNGSTEFRVLRPNGQVVMHGKYDSWDLGLEAKGNSASQTFAVRVMHSSSPVVPGMMFHASDLVQEEIRVYRATDGKRLAVVRTEAPAASHDGYSLSPDGSQLAVFSGTHVGIYTIPTN